MATRRLTATAMLLMASGALAQSGAPPESATPAPESPSPAATQTQVAPPPEPVTAPSRASVVVPSDRDNRESEGWRFQIGGGGAHAFDSDLDSAGNVSITRAALEFTFDAPIGSRARLAVDVKNEASFYDFEGATTLLPGTGDPWDTLYSVSVAPTLRVGVDANWSWFVGMDARFAGEADADIGDSLTFGAMAGARYAFSENFALTFGAFGSTRLEDDPLVLPLIGVEWKISDTLRLTTRGTGLSLTATLTETLEFSILGAWSSRDYRLEDDRLVNPEGVVRDTRIPVGVELAWSPTRAVRIALEAGIVAWQEYETFDLNGNDIADDNTDPTAYVGLAAVVRF